MSRTECLTPDELTGFHLGDLPENVLEELAGHLENCPRCEEAVRSLEGLSDPVIDAYRRSVQNGPMTVPGAPPARVGEYEILDEVGRGGMGVVYRGRHLKLQRTVALKMLLGGPYAHHDERARFRAEAEAVARLQHPGIVQIYEVGEHVVEADVARPYFTLEFVEGGNLSTLMAGRPQPPRQAAALLEALARAAHYAHQHGIVHRDLKPSNVLLTADGQPKICDFGVAKFLTGSDIKTLSGTLVGTAEYMAPEQASGRDTVGPAADIYALGAILYTALTGRPPFQGTSALHTLEQVRQQEPVPPRRLQPHVPRDLDTICLKCLEKEPGKRYPSALALADDLQRLLADEPIKARPASLGERCARWIRHNKAVAFALTAVTGILAVATTMSTTAAVQKEAERQKATKAEAVALAAQGRAESAQQLAEQRRELAIRNLYLAKTNLTGMTLDVPGSISQVTQLLHDWRGLKAQDDPRGWEWFYCQTLASRAQLTLRGHAADASALAWSPDGRRLASAGFDDTIRFWDATTGQQILCSAAPWGILSLSWSPDGRCVASANWSDKSVGLWDPATGKEVRSRLQHPNFLQSVAYSPDGLRLAAAERGERIIIWDLRAGKPVFALPGNCVEFTSACWSPDGRRLATSVPGNMVKIWDTDSGKEVGKLEGVRGEVSSVRWSPDGRKLATATWSKNLQIWDAATYTAIRALPDSLVEGFEGAICWSPDSSRVAAAGHDLAVRVWDADSGELLLTLWGHTGSHLAVVSWSPDGTRLASAERGWNGEIKVWQLDARPELHTLVVSDHSEPYLRVCWSPDGRKLATGHVDGMVQTWDVATGGLLAQMCDHTAYINEVSWSPDGRILASGSSDTTVKLWDGEDGRLLANLPGDNHAIASVSWSPDGKWLAWDTEDGTVRLREMSAGTVSRVSFRGHGAAWSPRGDRMAVGERPYKIRIHDAQTGALVSSWPTSVDSNNLPFWSPDGVHIASLSDYAVEVREAATGHAPFPPLRHTQRVEVLAWSPDSKELATATEDDRVHLWDAVTGNPILTLRAQAGPILWMAWSPDGMRLAYASSKGTIHIWDATRGYDNERAPTLLPLLNARIAADATDRKALRLRAGVYARMEDWDRAAADADRLAKLARPPEPTLFQAGWWIADTWEPGSPFEPGPKAPRWYLSPDDPNGYVPVANGQPYYLTRVYAPQPQQAVVELVKPNKVNARLWVNGAPTTDLGPTLVPLTQGWNMLAVRIEDTSLSSNILFHPRAGFYLRPRTQAEATKRPEQ